MALDSAPTPHAGHPTGYQVEPPRASDAIGMALRDAFERDLGVPEDMAAMLRLLGATQRDPRFTR